MSNNGDDAIEQETFDIRLRIGSDRVHLQARIPTGQMSLTDFIAVAQPLSDVLVGVGVREVERCGRTISCGPNCGACCRQLVPISEAEALYLTDLVARLPDKQRNRVLSRFEAAAESLAGRQLVEQLRAPWKTLDPIERRALGISYFRLQIPCPFLEDESCSIYPHRPIACREYLVTSPPANCAQPSAENVELVELPRRVSSLLYRFGDGVGNEQARWLPLLLTLDWANANGEKLRHQSFPGSSLFANFISQLLPGSA